MACKLPSEVKKANKANYAIAFNFPKFFPEDANAA